jgi:hypothetical protein
MTTVENSDSAHDLEVMDSGQMTSNSHLTVAALL